MDKERVKQLARALGLDCVGVTDAKPQYALAERLAKRDEQSPFEPADIPARTTPGMHLAGARSIIVCLFPYYTGLSAPSNLSRYAQLPDYHRVAHGLLSELAAGIAAECPGFAWRAFVDTGPLVDRYVAYRAGLGVLGKNHSLIHPVYGSYVFIGSLLTNLPLLPDAPLPGGCMGCGRCASACPGHALEADGTFHPGRCVSALTQQKQVSSEERALLAACGTVYGCDVCQEVCPHNRDLPITPIAAFRQDHLPALDLADVAALSGRGFARKYGKYPFAWRGKGIFEKYQ